MFVDYLCSAGGREGAEFSCSVLLGTGTLRSDWIMKSQGCTNNPHQPIFNLKLNSICSQWLFGSSLCSFVFQTGFCYIVRAGLKS